VTMPAGKKKEDDLASHIIAQMDASRITRNDDNGDEVQSLPSPPRHQETSASLRNVFSGVRSMSTLETLRDMRQSSAKCLSVIDPYEFYILLDCTKDQQRQLDDLMKASFSKEYLVHPMQLKENDNVIVWSTQFTCFARGRFVAYEKKHKLSARSTRNCIAEQAKSFCVRVYLIDYGFTEVLYLANVRSIDDGTGIFNFSIYPILHVKCSLAGVKPSPLGNWSSSAIALMRDLIEGKPIHVTFACKQNQIAYVSCEYLVSKVNYIRGGLLDHALVYSGHAVFYDLGSNDNDSSTYYNNAIFKNENLPSQGHVITGVVSHIDNPDLFYINKASQQDDMLNMQTDLQRFYSSPEAKKLIIFHPRPGLVCVAKFADDGQFYRAHIDDLNVKKKVALIKYIDYGNRAEINLQSEPIYYVTDEFFRYPVFAIRCCMGEIEPLNTAKWSDNATNCFRTFVQENPESTSFLVSVKVIRCLRESHRLEVSLTKWTGEGKSISVADQMITKKFAKKKVVEGQVDVNISRLIEEFKDINVNSFQILRETQERNAVAELPATHSLIPVKVFNAESPLSFYLQLAIENVQTLYKHMRDNLNNVMQVAAVPENSGANVPFHMNEKVAFRFREKWFRGEYFGAVEELQDNETNSQSEDKSENQEESTEKQKKFIILDIDGGYKFNGKLLPAIPASEVFKLPVQFLKDDPYAIHSSLGDISPAGGSQWSKRAMELFGKFILDNPFEEESRVYLHLKQVVQKERSAEPLKVNLVKIIKIDQGPFFPRKKVYQCLSEHLVEEGVALEIRNRAVDDQGPLPTDQEILNNPLANLRAPKKTQAPNDRDGTLVSMLLRFQENRPDPTDDKFIYSRHEDPSEEFAAVVTNIGNDGEIYFRLTSDNQLISEINTEIVRELNQRKLPPIDATTIIENRACTARFPFDDTWNRTKIIGLSSKKEHHIRIYFVDYGQLEEVLMEDIAGYVFCRHIPELAIRAKLHGIKIPSDLKSAAVDELYKLLVDKYVNVVWKNKPERSPMIVSMTIDLREHDDIMDVADWLLNKDLAIPFAGE